MNCQVRLTLAERALISQVLEQGAGTLAELARALRVFNALELDKLPEIIQTRNDTQERDFYLDPAEWEWLVAKLVKLAEAGRAPFVYARQVLSLIEKSKPTCE